MKKLSKKEQASKTRICTQMASRLSMERATEKEIERVANAIMKIPDHYVKDILELLEKQIHRLDDKDEKAMAREQ